MASVTNRCRNDGFSSLSVLRYAGLYEHTSMNVSGATTDLAGAVEEQRPAVVGERVQDGERVVPGLDDLVEVADRARPARPG